MLIRIAPRNRNDQDDQRRGYDLVSGWKKTLRRYLYEEYSFKDLHATARKVTGIKPTIWTAVLRHIVKRLSRILRYMEKCTVLFLIWRNRPFCQNREKVVQHQACKYGKSKFGLNCFETWPFDLLSAWFLQVLENRCIFLGVLAHYLIIGIVIAICWLWLNRSRRQEVLFSVLLQSSLFYLSCLWLW